MNSNGRTLTVTTTNGISVATDSHNTSSNSYVWQGNAGGGSGEPSIKVCLAITSGGTTTYVQKDP